MAVNGAGSSEAAANVEVTTDNGGAYVTVGGGLGMDRFGRGTVTWTAGPETIGNDAFVRVTGATGSMPQDESDRGFLIANDGSDYYVNDAVLTGD